MQKETLCNFWGKYYHENHLLPVAWQIYSRWYITLFAPGRSCEGDDLLKKLVHDNTQYSTSKLSQLVSAHFVTIVKSLNQLGFSSNRICEYFMHYQRQRCLIITLHVFHCCPVGNGKVFCIGWWWGWKMDTVQQYCPQKTLVWKRNGAKTNT